MWAVKIINEFINMQRETRLLPANPGCLVPLCTFHWGLLSRGPAAPSVALKSRGVGWKMVLRGGGRPACVCAQGMREGCLGENGCTDVYTDVCTAHEWACV